MSPCEHKVTLHGVKRKAKSDECYHYYLSQQERCLMYLYFKVRVARTSFICFVRNVFVTNVCVNQQHAFGQINV